MSLYLKWSNYSAGSVKRIVSNMFSYLSPRWYPVNIMGTSIYNMLYMSAGQLSSASTEIASTYNDLDIDLVRTIPVSTSYNAKIYDNFGVLLQTSKQNTQNYESFNNTYKLQDYRTNLKLLNEASLVATTLTSIDLVGQSYTGVAPYTIDRQLLGYDGWSLYLQTGSVVAVGSDFILSDRFIPRIGRIIPTHLGTPGTEGMITSINTTVPTINGGQFYDVGDKVKISTGNGDAIATVLTANPSDGGRVLTVGLFYGGSGGYTVSSGNTTEKITGEGNDELKIEITGIDTFYVGDKFEVSWTKLGHNTKIYSRKQVYNGLDIEIFSSTSTASFKSSIEKNITRVLRADVDPRYFYKTTYTLGLASGSATYDSGYFELKNSYVTNKGGTILGSENGKNAIISSVLDTTAALFHTYSAMMDWTCISKNDSYYDRYLRSYASSSIPDTVYYQKVSSEPITWMDEPDDCGVHWIAYSSGSICDVSGNLNNLQISSASNYPSLEIGRNTDRMAYSMNYPNHGSSSVMLYTGSTTRDIDSYGGLTAEFWINGIDKYFADGTGLIILKREATGSVNDSLTSNGYMVVIDATGSTFSYHTRSGSVVSVVSASIASYLLEEPRRYHYFALTLKNNKVRFFIDGTLISSGSVSANPQNLTSTPTELYISNNNTSQYNVAFDEIMISSGALTNTEIKNRFNSYAPRYTDPVDIPYYLVDNYYQSKVSVFASGSGDFQYYGCAMRAVEARNYRKKDTSYYNLYNIPLEKI